VIGFAEIADYDQRSPEHQARVSRDPKDFAILKSGPPALLNGADIVPDDFPGKVTWQLFIEQDAHQRSKPRERSQEP